MVRIGCARSSPRVPVTIKSDAASRIATANVTVTSPIGVFIISGRAVSTARCRAKITGKMLTENMLN
jgi:hypothetical protein